MHLCILNEMVIETSHVCQFVKIRCYQTSEVTSHLKELEHRKFGWKVLILKYDLGKSLSKEMWWNMSDTKKFLDYIFKKMKNACNMR